MKMTRTIPEIPIAVEPNRTIRDSLVTSGEMLSWMQQTTSIARRISGQTHVLAFNDVLHAPRCHPKDDDKFYLVSDGYLAGTPNDLIVCEFQIPWYVSEGFSVIGARIVFRSNIAWPLSIQMETDTLIDATTKVTGRASASVIPQSNSYPIQGSAIAPNDPPTSWQATVDTYLKPVLPASREVAVKFHLNFYQTAAEAAFYGFGNYNGYAAIQSVSIWDHPDEPEVA